VKPSSQRDIRGGDEQEALRRGTLQPCPLLTERPPKNWGTSHRREELGYHTEEMGAFLRLEKSGGNDREQE